MTNMTCDLHEEHVVSIELPDVLLAEAYSKSASRNVLAALNPSVFFGYFSACVDGGGHGSNTTFPGLDWGQQCEALLFLGRIEEVLASWEYIRQYQRPDGLLPFAILPSCAGQTINMLDSGNYLQVNTNGGVYDHWVSGNMFRALANTTALMTADAILRITQDREWLIGNRGYLRGLVDWLFQLITVDDLVEGHGYYLERPARFNVEGIDQCYTAYSFDIASSLFLLIGDEEYARLCKDAAKRVTRSFRTHFWAGDHCVEYIHPSRGAIDSHGLTDVDWASIATDLASDQQIEVLWPQLKDNRSFIYNGVPTGISTRPEEYEAWEFQNLDRHDLAAMGRVWYLEAWARARMGDANGLIQSLHRVAEAGRANGWYWYERYYSEKTGDLASHRINKYVEYPANLIRIIQKFVFGLTFEIDGSVTLSPTAPESYWRVGFGQTLRWCGRVLSYRLATGRLSGTYRGTDQQTMRIRVPEAGSLRITSRSNGSAANVIADGDQIAIHLPPSVTDNSFELVW